MGIHTGSLKSFCLKNPTDDDATNAANHLTHGPPPPPQSLAAPNGSQVHLLLDHQHGATRSIAVAVVPLAGAFNWLVWHRTVEDVVVCAGRSRGGLALSAGCCSAGGGGGGGSVRRCAGHSYRMGVSVPSRCPVAWAPPRCRRPTVTSRQGRRSEQKPEISIRGVVRKLHHLGPQSRGYTKSAGNVLTRRRCFVVCCHTSCGGTTGRRARCPARIPVTNSR